MLSAEEHQIMLNLHIHDVLSAGVVLQTTSGACAQRRGLD